MIRAHWPPAARMGVGGMPGVSGHATGRGIEIAEIEVGAVIDGTVERITPYGAFLKLEDGRLGLVHISEIDRNYVKDVHDHLREADVVQAKVLAIKEDGKIDLSIKALQDPPPDAPAPRQRPRVRAEAQALHEAERRAAGRLQARGRAQAEVGPTQPLALTTQRELRSGRRRPPCASSLGREPTTPFVVVCRCTGGHPLVIRNAPLDADGRPVPHDLLAHLSRRPSRRSRAMESVGCDRASSTSASTATRCSPRRWRRRTRRTPRTARRIFPRRGAGAAWPALGPGSSACMRTTRIHLAGGEDPVGAWVAERVEPVHPEQRPGRVAAIDQGTNSCRLLVVEPGAPR